MRRLNMLCNPEIVEMTVENIDEVIKVENLSFSIPWSKNAFIQEITGNKFARYICAKINGKVVGYAGMWKICDEGHITNVAVHPEFRGNGLGNALVEHLINMAKREGIASMTLEVRQSNVVAQKLYEKYGFRAYGVRKSYYADNGENAIIMWKDKV